MAHCRVSFSLAVMRAGVAAVVDVSRSCLCGSGQAVARVELRSAELMLKLGWLSCMALAVSYLLDGSFGLVLCVRMSWSSSGGRGRVRHVIADWAYGARRTCWVDG